MKQLSEFPIIRTDLEIIAQPSPGKPDRYLIKEPESSNILELSEKEIFICRQLDGNTSLALIRSRLRNQYNLDISLEHLEAFVRQMKEEGLLVSPDAQARKISYGWKQTKPLPLCFNRLFIILSNVFEWTFARWFLTIFFIFLVITFIIIVNYGDFLIYEITSFFTSIIEGVSLSFSSQNVLQLIFIFILIPFLREIYKLFAYQHYAACMPDIRYMWCLYFIPRFYLDTGTIFRIKEKKKQLYTAASGPKCELLLVVIGVIGWEITRTDDLLKSLWLNLAIASTINFLLNVNPLGQGDGNLLLSIWLGIKNFRQRAVKTAWSWLLHQPVPEPLSSKEMFLFKWFGILAGGYSGIFNILILGFGGYLLINWFEGIGFILFLMLIGLRFEDEIRRFAMNISLFKWLGLHLSPLLHTPGVRKWLIGSGIILLIVVIYFIPYSYEVAGEFRIQPISKQEIHVEIQEQIEKIWVKEGSWVKKGQLIAQLSKHRIQKDLEQTQASLKGEIAELSLLENGPAPETIAKAEQEVTVRNTNLQYSTSKLNRFSELYQKGHISEQDYENILAERNVNLDMFELAKRNLEVVKSKPRPEQIDSQKAEVEQLQILVEHLKDDLARTDIYSPVEGQVTTFYIKEKEGQRLEIGDLVAIVEDNRKVIARISLPEEYASDVKIGSCVRLKPWSYSEKVFIGTVTAIAPVIIDKNEELLLQHKVEQQSGMISSLNAPRKNIFCMLAEISSSNGLLKSDMSGYAKIRAKSKPLGAVFLGPVIRFFCVQVWSWLP